MTHIPSTPPPPRVPRTDDPIVPLPVANDGGIEGILLQLEDQSRRARDLRNDARDARREQQAHGIREAHKAARLQLAGSLVEQVGSTVASLARSAGGGDTDDGARTSPTGGKPTSGASDLGPDITISGGATATGSDAPSSTEGTAGLPTGAPKTANAVEQRAGDVWASAGAAATEASATLIAHFATRAEIRGEVAGHAAQTYADVASDAETAAQDARQMVDRARQHLDAILAARREAGAAILRG